MTLSTDGVRPLRLLAYDVGLSLRDILKRIDLSPDVLDESRVASIALAADYFRMLERLSNRP